MPSPEAARVPSPKHKPNIQGVRLSAETMAVYVPPRKPRLMVAVSAAAVVKRSETWPQEYPVGGHSDIYKQVLRMLHDGQAEEGYDALRPYLDADGAGEPEHLNWLAGLATYRMERYSLAENYFKASAALADGDPWLRAAAYFWASRSAVLDNNYDSVSAYLNEAAKEKRTFYGLVAQRALGRSFVDGAKDAAYYPVAGWKPSDGWRVDPALVHAFIRQESRFVARAQNPSGATGVMQLMPATAALFMNGDRSTVQDRLRDPQTSVTVGQKYLERLLKYTDGRMFSLVMAYNAGPKAVDSWEQNLVGIRDSDPLLFIELVPYSETRSFVERVMANYWIYQNRLGQPTKTLDAVAAGDAPIYAYGGMARQQQIAFSE